MFGIIKFILGIFHLHPFPRDQPPPNRPRNAVVHEKKTEAHHEQQNALAELNDKHKLTNANTHYNVQDEIGRGRIGQVIRVAELKTNTIRAVKILKKSALKNPSFFRNTLKEVSILKKLRHPNLLNVLKVHYDDDLVYIKTPFCAQGTLEDIIRQRGSLDELTALRVINCLLNVLYFLYHNGVAHRDIRPKSLLFDARGALRLSNFGFAYIRETGSSGTSTLNYGSRPYAAPEVLVAKVYNPATADMWSVGAVMYFMLTHRRLFLDSDETVRVAYEKAHQEDVGLAMLDSDIIKRSKRTRDILWGLLQVDPKKRNTAKETMSMCDDAIRSVQAAKQTRSRNRRPTARTTQTNASGSVVPRRTFNCKCGLYRKT